MSRTSAQRANEIAAPNGSQSAPTGPDAQGTHHWVLSVQWPTKHRGGRMSGANYGSTTTPAPGETRADVYDRIRNHVYRDLLATIGVDSPTVVFWTLEPNQLGSAT